MTEIEKKIVEIYTEDNLQYFALKHAVFSQDVEITFNGKTEYFSKEKLMNLVKDIKHEWVVIWDTLTEEVRFRNFTPSNWYVQICLTRYLNNWEAKQ